MPDWNALNPSKFERLCFRLVAEEGFKNVKHYGGTGDRARDIVAEYIVEVGGSHETIRYLIQCKRITSRKSIAVSDISNLKDWMDSNHQFQRALVITPADVSADTRDWLDGINRSSKYKIDVWDGIELERKLAKYPALFNEYFSTARIAETLQVHNFLGKQDELTKCQEIKFQTNGGPIIFDGEITSLASVSGSGLRLTMGLDGNNLNSQFITLTSLPAGQRVFWRKDEIAAGEYTASLFCKTSAPSFEIINSRIRIIELPRYES
jgi:hypothetical protein